MSYTKTFYVTSKDNKLKQTENPSRDYFHKDGKFAGQAKYLIEIFGKQHETNAELIKKMIDDSGNADKFFHIKVEFK